VAKRQEGLCVEGRRP